ncbi:MAG TPA: phosphatase domain-containing protein [Longimicrobiales bacterium]|nr:phosphatase domain-containing protein [Longimicrobiales bacterium]
MSLSPWERWLGRMARDVERRIETTRARVLGDRAARQVVVYRGFGTCDEVFVSGRVLANRPVGPAMHADAWWRNLGNTLRHLESDEVPGATVHVQFHGAAVTTVTDDEGYFRAWLRPPAPPDNDLWHEVAARVIEPVHDDTQDVAAGGRVIIPRSSAAFGVISDIDDTVIRTDATRLLGMLRRTLLENALTRLPFPGVAQFYSGLHAGTDGTRGNPVFYVSSSPWNLYALLTEFLEHQAIPAGPLLLRDWGISESGALPLRHGEHKLGAIRQILDRYPTLPFILIGDSGQEDPEIYSTIVHEYPRRILAVYIRSVAPAADRIAAVRQLGQEVRQAGSELLLTDDTLTCARHAVDRGWMDKGALAAVAAVSASAGRQR